VEAGGTLLFSVKVDGTGGHSETVKWDVINNKSQDTKIASVNATTGKLTVGANETSTALTVKASSTADPSKSRRGYGFGNRFKLPKSGYYRRYGKPLIASVGSQRENPSSSAQRSAAQAIPPRA
jgi:hypothetical protein